MVKHLNELAGSLKDHEKAVFLQVFQYRITEKKERLRSTHYGPSTLIVSCRLYNRFDLDAARIQGIYDQEIAKLGSIPLLILIRTPLSIARNVYYNVGTDICHGEYCGNTIRFSA